MNPDTLTRNFARMGARVLFGPGPLDVLRDKQGEFLSGHSEVRTKAIALLDSPAAKVFDVRNEPDAVKARFGANGFGLQALMAA
ncbi:MAG: hypothetical protein HC807_05985, partial [Gammaproteobacteria bacterium]|nr:hypothetical protein [Gammaproteobacteria bacterium]